MLWKKKFKAAELLDEPRNVHYVFAHQALRQLCQEDPLRFFAIIGSEEQMDFLAWAWGVTEKNVGEKADGYRVEEVAVTRGRILDRPGIIVQLPQPRATAEAHFVGIVLDVPLSEASPPEKVGFRYFVLECGTHLDGTERTVLCEWTADGDHRNYGDGPAITVQDFVAAIEKRLVMK
ncbi:hypothetical protein [Parachitinimonas caeni]|uniref:Uncharacterized protein n=1 Tax=Parachitinimonas caeni TaxID=3031301 RepID=A0ABT7DVH2_9NEIS|nr:hypothetical protein [Parachitinimonas caeni]MDK2124067.1 hypothetical protein [Parachitinimonas caeni]